MSAPGDELDKVQARFYFDGMIQRSGRTGGTIGGDEEISHIPPEWVLGVYDRETQLVTMNPGFSGRRVTPDDFKNSTGGRYEKYIREREIIEHFGEVGLLPGGMDPTLALSNDVPQAFEDYDGPLVW